MYRVIGVTELQRRFKAVFDEVARRRVPYVLTRGSRPEAVLISYEEFIRYQELDEQGILERFDRLCACMEALNAERSEDEIAADVALARAEYADQCAS